MFKTARQNKVTQKIIDQIRTAILEGKLKPGDRLPPEKELTAQFQVSKQTLRESLRALEHMGLIDIRKGTGGGAFIVEVDIHITRESLANFLYFKNLSIENLSEVRKLIEPHAAAKAAKGINTEGKRNLKRLNEEARRLLHKQTGEDISRNEVDFHRTIAQATRNPILILMLDFVENLLEDFKKILKPDAAFSRSVLEAHERIYDAVCANDSKTAAAEMLRHVSEVEVYLARLKQDVDLWRVDIQRNTG